MKIGIENYSSAEKNKWRYRVWREIARRVKSPHLANVLYLSAIQDLDRRQAVSLGFKANNLICVDIDPDVVDRHRANSKLAILGDIKDVAYFWRGIEVIHMDFCNGLTEDNFSKINNIISGASIEKGSVVVINLLRGRESGVAAQNIKLMQGFLEKHKSHLGNQEVKHRGALLLMYIALHQAWAVKQMGSYVDPFDLFMGIFVAFEPKFYSYKSTAGSQIFDSLVMSAIDTHGGGFFLSDAASIKMDKYIDSMKGLRAQISAVKAVQTMRKNGKLAPCSNF